MRNKIIMATMLLVMSLTVGCSGGGKYDYTGYDDGSYVVSYDDEEEYYDDEEYSDEEEYDEEEYDEEEYDEEEEYYDDEEEEYEEEEYDEDDYYIEGDDDYSGTSMDISDTEFIFLGDLIDTMITDSIKDDTSLVNLISGYSEGLGTLRFLSSKYKLNGYTTYIGIEGSDIIQVVTITTEDYGIYGFMLVQELGSNTAILTTKAEKYLTYEAEDINDIMKKSDSTSYSSKSSTAVLGALQSSLDAGDIESGYYYIIKSKGSSYSIDKEKHQ